MKKQLTTKFLAILAVVCLSCFIACDKIPKEENDTKYEACEAVIGMFVPLSDGELGSQGLGGYRSAYLAAEEINQRGVLRYCIKIIPIDSQNLDTASLVTEYAKKIAELKQQLTGNQILLGIIGDYSSKKTIALSEVTIPQGLLLISPASTAPSITDLDDNNLVFRLAPSDKYQGALAAKHAYEQDNVKNVFIVAINNDYGHGLATVFDTTLQNYPNTHAEIRYTEEGAEDFSDIVDEIANTTPFPDLIYLPTYAESAIKIVNALGKTELGLSETSLALSEAMYSEYEGNNFITKVDDGALSKFKKSWLLAPANTEDEDRYNLWKQKYEERYKATPPIFSSQVYDAVYLMIYAMLRSAQDTSDITSSEQIAMELLEVSRGGDEITNTIVSFESHVANCTDTLVDVNYIGASGDIDFDENGDIANGCYNYYLINNNRFDPVDTLKKCFP